MAIPFPKAQRCYVAASFGQTPSAVADVLRREGVSVTSSTVLPPSTGAIRDAVRQAIGEADLVIGVLGGFPEPNVVFELGVALGLRKPCIVIASSTAMIPLDLQGVPVIKADATDKSAIAYGLSRALRGWRSTAAPYLAKPPEHSLGNAVGKYITQFETATQIRDQSAMAKAVAQALEATGLIVETKVAPDYGADIAVWSDELQGVVGNPVLIELKWHSFGATFSDLLSYMSRGEARFGLVLTIDNDQSVGATDSAFTATGGLVARMPARQFLARLEGQSFSQIVRALRNTNLGFV